MNRGARLLTAAVALLLGAPVAPGAAETTTGAYAAYEIVRVRNGGPAQVTMDVTVSHGNRVVIGAIAVLRVRGRNQVVAALTGELWTDRPATLYATGTELAADCVPSQPCVSGGSIGAGFRVTGSTQRGLSFVVAGPAAGMRVKVNSKYWKARPLPGAARAVTGEDAALGATAGPRRAEVFRSAIAPGGKYGSAVLAQVPCGDQESYGSATFTGDGGEVVMHCGAERDRRRLTYAQQATTWSLSGTLVSVGADMSPTRLFVIDVPK